MRKINNHIGRYLYFFNAVVYGEGERIRRGLEIYTGYNFTIVPIFNELCNDTAHFSTTSAKYDLFHFYNLFFLVPIFYSK